MIREQLADAGQSGNPQACNLFEIAAYLQKIDGTVLEVLASTVDAA